MICKEFYELLDNYELLSDIQRTELENHTCECDSCRKEYEFFGSIVNISASIPAPCAPKSLIDDVNARLDAECKPVVRFKPNFRVMSTVAACLAIGLVVGINNGYIKKNIEPTDTDGVIKETVVATEKAIDEVSAETETEPVSKSEKPIVEAVVKATKKPEATVTTQAPTKAPLYATSSPTKAPVATPDAVKTEVIKETQAPAPTENVEAAIGQYEVIEADEQMEFGFYSVGSKGRTTENFSDYLYVKSDDMGTVVSTMSEMGFKTEDGYYLTSRVEFYKFINILNDKGVGYECDLTYDTNEEIAFKLTYN